MRPLIIVLVGLVMACPVFGKWASYEDAPYEILMLDRSVQVRADGSSTSITTFKVKVLKQSGRRLWANNIQTYNSNMTRFTVLDAYTLVHGHKLEVKRDAIEDKPLASRSSAFDQLHQVLIAFPKVDLGSEIYLKVREDNVANIPNYYSLGVRFGSDAYLRKAKLTVNSKLPLSYEVNDPQHHLKVISNSNSQGGTHLVAKLNKAIYTQVINEDSYIAPDKETVLVISSAKKWSEIINIIRPGFVKVIKQPLPPLMAKIRQQAQQEKTDSGKINAVTSRLASQIQYMSDARTALSRFTPHDLLKIEQLGLGDCKDYTAATSAILSRLGFKVTPALVLRGERARMLPTKLPFPWYFNHVILRAQKSGKAYWVDPTNFVSMVDGIFPDIANKPALLLSSTTTTLAQIPQVDLNHNQVYVKSNWQLENDKLYRAQGLIQLSGESALYVTGAGLKVSNSAIESTLLNGLATQYLPKQSHLQLPDLSKRVVTDLDLPFFYVAPQQQVNTNLGHATKLHEFYQISNLLELDPERGSDIYLGAPQSRYHIFHIQHFKADQLQRLYAHVNSPWFELQRRVERKSDGITIYDEWRRKQSIMSNEDYRGQAFADFKQQYNKYFANTAVLANNRPKASMSPRDK